MWLYFLLGLFKGTPVHIYSNIPAITENIVLITGFNQSHGSDGTGLDDLHHYLHSEYSSRNCMVTLKNWNDNFRSLAATINRNRFRQQTRVFVISYSWGTGNGAVSLALELQRHGIRVSHLFSIDGVYKPWFPLPVRSLFSRWNPLAPVIKVPNTDMITYWRQTTSRPMGHEIRGDENCVMCPGNDEDGVIPKTCHQNMDVSPEIHASIRSSLGRHFFVSRFNQRGDQ